MTVENDSLQVSPSSEPVTELIMGQVRIPIYPAELRREKVVLTPEELATKLTLPGRVVDIHLIDGLLHIISEELAST